MIPVPSVFLHSMKPDPLSSEESKHLLETLLTEASRPSVPTSSHATLVEQKDNQDAKEATHVYVRVDNPKSLMPKYSGPFEIVSRPSDSTIQIKTGNFVSGKPKLELHTWARAKPAFMRPDAVVAERPKRGRPQKIPATVSVPDPPSTEETRPNDAVIQLSENVNNNTPDSNVGGKRQPRTTRNPAPNYVNAVHKPSSWSASQLELANLNNQINNPHTLISIIS